MLSDQSSDKDGSQEMECTHTDKTCRTDEDAIPSLSPLWVAAQHAIMPVHHLFLAFPKPQLAHTISLVNRWTGDDTASSTPHAVSLTSSPVPESAPVAMNELTCDSVKRLSAEMQHSALRLLDSGRCTHLLQEMFSRDEHARYHTTHACNALDHVAASTAQSMTPDLSTQSSTRVPSSTTATGSSHSIPISSSTAIKESTTMTMTVDRAIAQLDTDIDTALRPPLQTALQKASDRAAETRARAAVTGNAQSPRIAAPRVVVPLYAESAFQERSAMPHTNDVLGCQRKKEKNTPAKTACGQQSGDERSERAALSCMTVGAMPSSREDDLTSQLSTRQHVLANVHTTTTSHEKSNSTHPLGSDAWEVTSSSAAASLPSDAICTDSTDTWQQSTALSDGATLPAAAASFPLHNDSASSSAAHVAAANGSHSSNNNSATSNYTQHDNHADTTTSHSTDISTSSHTNLYGEEDNSNSTSGSNHTCGARATDLDASTGAADVLFDLNADTAMLERYIFSLTLDAHPFRHVSVNDLCGALIRLSSHAVLDGALHTSPSSSGSSTTTRAEEENAPCVSAMERLVAAAAPEPIGASTTSMTTDAAQASTSASPETALNRVKDEAETDTSANPSVHCVDAAIDTVWERSVRALVCCTVLAHPSLDTDSRRCLVAGGVMDRLLTTFACTLQRVTQILMQACTASSEDVTLFASSWTASAATETHASIVNTTIDESALRHRMRHNHNPSLDPGNNNRNSRDDKTAGRVPNSSLTCSSTFSSASHRSTALSPLSREGWLRWLRHVRTFVRVWATLVCIQEPVPVLSDEELCRLEELCLRGIFIVPHRCVRRVYLVYAEYTVDGCIYLYRCLWCRLVAQRRMLAEQFFARLVPSELMLLRTYRCRDAEQVPASCAGHAVAESWSCMPLTMAVLAAVQSVVSCNSMQDMHYSGTLRSHNTADELVSRTEATDDVDTNHASCAASSDSFSTHDPSPTGRANGDGRRNVGDAVTEYDGADTLYRHCMMWAVLIIQQWAAIPIMLRTKSSHVALCSEGVQQNHSTMKHAAKRRLDAEDRAEHEVRWQAMVQLCEDLTSLTGSVEWPVADVLLRCCVTAVTQLCLQPASRMTDSHRLSHDESAIMRIRNDDDNDTDCCTNEEEDEEYVDEHSRQQGSVPMKTTLSQSARSVTRVGKRARADASLSRGRSDRMVEQRRLLAVNVLGSVALRLCSLHTLASRTGGDEAAATASACVISATTSYANNSNISDNDSDYGKTDEQLRCCAGQVYLDDARMHHWCSVLAHHSPIASQPKASSDTIQCEDVDDAVARLSWQTLPGVSQLQSVVYYALSRRVERAMTVDGRMTWMHTRRAHLLAWQLLQRESAPPQSRRRSDPECDDDDKERAGQVKVADDGEDGDRHAHSMATTLHTKHLTTSVHLTCSLLSSRAVDRLSRITVTPVGEPVATLSPAAVCDVSSVSTALMSKMVRLLCMHLPHSSLAAAMLRTVTALLLSVLSSAASHVSSEGEDNGTVCRTTTSTPAKTRMTHESYTCDNHVAHEEEEEEEDVWHNHADDKSFHRADRENAEKSTKDEKSMGEDTDEQEDDEHAGGYGGSAIRRAMHFFTQLLMLQPALHRRVWPVVRMYASDPRARVREVVVPLMLTLLASAVDEVSTTPTMTTTTSVADRSPSDLSSNSSSVSADTSHTAVPLLHAEVYAMADVVWAALLRDLADSRVAIVTRAVSAADALLREARYRVLFDTNTAAGAAAVTNMQMALLRKLSSASACCAPVIRARTFSQGVMRATRRVSVDIVKIFMHRWVFSHSAQNRDNEEDDDVLEDCIMGAGRTNLLAASAAGAVVENDCTDTVRMLPVVPVTVVARELMALTRMGSPHFPHEVVCAHSSSYANRANTQTNHMSSTMHGAGVQDSELRTHPVVTLLWEMMSCAHAGSDRHLAAPNPSTCTSGQQLQTDEHCPPRPKRRRRMRGVVTGSTLRQMLTAVVQVVWSEWECAVSAQTALTALGTLHTIAAVCPAAVMAHWRLLSMQTNVHASAMGHHACALALSRCLCYPPPPDAPWRMSDMWTAGTILHTCQVITTLLRQPYHAFSDEADACDDDYESEHTRTTWGDGLVRSAVHDEVGGKQERGWRTRRPHPHRLVWAGHAVCLDSLAPSLTQVIARYVGPLQQRVIVAACAALTAMITSVAASASPKFTSPSLSAGVRVNRTALGLCYSLMNRYYTHVRALLPRLASDAMSVSYVQRFLFLLSEFLRGYAGWARPDMTQVLSQLVPRVTPAAHSTTSTLSSCAPSESASQPPRGSEWPSQEDAQALMEGAGGVCGNVYALTVDVWRRCDEADEGLEQRETPANEDKRDGDTNTSRVNNNNNSSGNVRTRNDIHSNYPSSKHPRTNKKVSNKDSVCTSTLAESPDTCEAIAMVEGLAHTPSQMPRNELPTRCTDECNGCTASTAASRVKLRVIALRVLGSLCVLDPRTYLPRCEAVIHRVLQTSMTTRSRATTTCSSPCKGGEATCVESDLLVQHGLTLIHDFLCEEERRVEAAVCRSACTSLPLSDSAATGRATTPNVRARSIASSSASSTATSTSTKHSTTHDNRVHDCSHHGLTDGARDENSGMSTWLLQRFHAPLVHLSTHHRLARVRELCGGVWDCVHQAGLLPPHRYLDAVIALAGDVRAVHVAQQARLCLSRVSQSHSAARSSEWWSSMQGLLSRGVALTFVLHCCTGVHLVHSACAESFITATPTAATTMCGECETRGGPEAMGAKCGELLVFDPTLCALSTPSLQPCSEPPTAPSASFFSATTERMATTSAARMPRVRVCRSIHNALLMTVLPKQARLQLCSALMRYFQDDTYALRASFLTANEENHTSGGCNGDGADSVYACNVVTWLAHLATVLTTLTANTNTPNVAMSMQHNPTPRASLSRGAQPTPLVREAHVAVLLRHCRSGVTLHGQVALDAVTAVCARLGVLCERRVSDARSGACRPTRGCLSESMSTAEQTAQLTRAGALDEQQQQQQQQQQLPKKQRPRRKTAPDSKKHPTDESDETQRLAKTHEHGDVAEDALGWNMTALWRAVSVVLLLYMYRTLTSPHGGMTSSFVVSVCTLVTRVSVLLSPLPLALHRSGVAVDAAQKKRKVNEEDVKSAVAAWYAGVQFLQTELTAAMAVDDLVGACEAATLVSHTANNTSKNSSSIRGSGHVCGREDEAACRVKRRRVANA